MLAAGIAMLTNRKADAIISPLEKTPRRY